MKSFLTIKKKPIVKWTKIPDGIFYEGRLPKGYDLAVSPGQGYIVVDVDRHEDGEDGFKNIPDDMREELNSTFNYPTRNNGAHYWFKYTGDKVLACKPSGIGIDLRYESKGYVVYYRNDDIRDNTHLINDSSNKMNKWLEELFYSKALNKK